MRHMAVELFDCPGEAQSVDSTDLDLEAPEALAADPVSEHDAHRTANSGTDQAESVSITINQRA